MNGFQVARDGARIYVRVFGLASMKNAPILDAFLRSQAGPAIETLCVDLSQCQGMDSTFMGLLVGMSSEFKSVGGRVIIVNPSETCLKLLDMLGVSQVMPVIPRCAAPELEFVALDDAAAAVGTLQRMELIRRAHHSLSGVNEANRAKFAAFIAALEADLAKLH